MESSLKKEAGGKQRQSVVVTEYVFVYMYICVCTYVCVRVCIKSQPKPHQNAEINCTLNEACHPRNRLSVSSNN